MSNNNKINILVVVGGTEWSCYRVASSLFSCSSLVSLCQPSPCSHRLMIQDADCSRSSPRRLINANKRRLRGDCDRIALIGNEMGTLWGISALQQAQVCKQRRCVSNWRCLRVRPARLRVPSHPVGGARKHWARAPFKN